MIEERPLGKTFSVFVIRASSPCPVYVLETDVTASLNQVNQPDVPVEIILCNM